MQSGRGNYLAEGELADQWYIDYDFYYEYENENEEQEIDWEMLEYDIDEMMIEVQKRFPSFDSISQWGDCYWEEQYLLENKLFRIGRAYNQWSEAIFIQEKNDLSPEEKNLARNHFKRYCDGIKSIMLDYIGQIHIRNGAWCSSTLTKKEEERAV